MTQEQEYMPTQADYSEMFVALSCNDIRAIGENADKYTMQQLAEYEAAMDKALLAIMISKLKRVS